MNHDRRIYLSTLSVVARNGIGILGVSGVVSFCRRLFSLNGFRAGFSIFFQARFLQVLH